MFPKFAVISCFDIGGEQCEARLSARLAGKIFLSITQRDNGKLANLTCSCFLVFNKRYLYILLHRSANFNIDCSVIYAFYYELGGLGFKQSNEASHY